MTDEQLAEKFVRLQVHRQNAPMSILSMVNLFGAERVASLLRALDLGARQWPHKQIFYADEDGWRLTNRQFVLARRIVKAEAQLGATKTGCAEERAAKKDLAARRRKKKRVAPQIATKEPDPDRNRPREFFPRGGAVDAVAYMEACGTVPEPRCVLSVSRNLRLALGDGCYRYVPDL